MTLYNYDLKKFCLKCWGRDMLCQCMPWILCWWIWQTTLKVVGSYNAVLLLFVEIGYPAFMKCNCEIQRFCVGRFQLSPRGRFSNWWCVVLADTRNQGCICPFLVCLIVPFRLQSSVWRKTSGCKNNHRTMCTQRMCVCWL